MFQELASMLAAGDALTINVVAQKDGRMALTVLPKGTFADKGLATGLSLEGTPAELDTDLSTVLGQYVTARKSLSDQVAATTTILDAARKDSAAKATSARLKATAPQPAAGASSAEVSSDDNDDGGEGDESVTAAGAAAPPTGTASASGAASAPAGTTSASSPVPTLDLF